MKAVVIEVPSPLGLWPTGVETAPDALRQAGLHARLGVLEPVRVKMPPYSGVRDPETQILNPAGIATVAVRLAAAVDRVLDQGSFPVVLGGDCSILLGPMLALRRRGRYGLVFADGHADFCHPEDEPVGQAASLDLALVTGRGPDQLANLEGRRPLVRDADVALVGYRAFGDNDRYRDEHVRGTAITIADESYLRTSGVDAVVERTLAAVTGQDLDGFWVHFDVDVLHDDSMPAVDYRYPGGVTWEDAAQILGRVLAAPGARGLEITIFNPRLDPDGDLARQLSDLIVSSVPGRVEP